MCLGTCVWAQTTVDLIKKSIFFAIFNHHLPGPTISKPDTCRIRMLWPPRRPGWCRNPTCVVVVLVLSHVYNRGQQHPSSSSCTRGSDFYTYLLEKTWTFHEEETQKTREKKCTIFIAVRGWDSNSETRVVYATGRAEFVNVCVCAMARKVANSTRAWHTVVLCPVE